MLPHCQWQCRGKHMPDRQVTCTITWKIHTGTYCSCLQLLNGECCPEGWR